MIWLLAIVAVLGFWVLPAIAHRADERAEADAQRLKRARRLYRVASGTATEQDYADTRLYEMEKITHAEDFATFCERNGFRV